MKLILASASPRRRHLLKSLKIPFRVIASNVSESSSIKNPKKLVRELALRKARAIAQKLNVGVILGADTLVVLEGKILGKPKDAKDAYRMLYRLSGSTHYVYTGVAVVQAETGKTFVSHARSVVKMKKIPLPLLLKLAKRNLDKAGAYAIQEKKDPMARLVKGSYDNVVGLPMTTVKALLKKLSRAA